MTGPERGYLLLTSQLGNPDRKPLTVAQFRELAKRAQAGKRESASRDLKVEDLKELGYDDVAAGRILGLLSDGVLLKEYLRKAELHDCYPVTRLNPLYPLAVRRRLGLDSPGVLWAKGDISLLGRPAVAVIGSRDLKAENQTFAEEAGRAIAEQGYVLVSGNARGADKIAQEAALEAGGSVISVVADSLRKKPLTRKMLYLSLDEFDQSFSVQRALHRNHVIHSMACLTISAQCSLGKGGTWDGILANLKYGWTPVCMYDDGSEAIEELQNRGVHGITQADLVDLSALSRSQTSFMNK